jgi:hypothetical protein
MRNHGQDDIDLDRASNLIGHPEDSTDPRDKWLAAGANDDLAFLMAMLALAEGAGREEPTDRHPSLQKPETLERPVESFEERAVAKAVIDLESSE